MVGLMQACHTPAHAPCADLTSVQWPIVCLMHACAKEWDYSNMSLPNAEVFAGLLQATHLAEGLGIAAGAVARGRQAT